MSAIPVHSSVPDRPAALTLLPLLATVFLGFVVVGLALPVLPLHVHQGLGQGTFMVGLVTGIQFAAALLTRMWAGNHADTRGPKKAVIAGLAGAAAGGILYLASLRFTQSPGLSAAILLLGRAVLGAGESFLITGALAWGLALIGAQNTGKVMAWMGTAMYAAFAVGAPAGTALYARFGFTAIALATAVLPVATLLLVAPLRPTDATARVRPSFLKVLASVWVPGVGLALASIGFGATTAFIALLFAGHGWTPAWPAFTAFAVCFMLARVFMGNLADRFGGTQIALASIALETAGQLLVWGASGPTGAIVGAALTGLGYSLIYPALGVEAVRRAPPESRALAMGAYTACLDLALGFGTPALGYVAGQSGVDAIFLVSAGVVASAAAVVLHLIRERARLLRLPEG